MVNTVNEITDEAFSNMKTNSNNKALAELDKINEKLGKAMQEHRETTLKLVTTIKHKVVEDETLQGFYKQISNNIMVGLKATYFVCRDLAHAEDKLDEVSFQTLVGQLKDSFSRSTIEKYIAIGNSERLDELYSQARIPFKWTTQYAIATLSDEEWEMCKDSITADTTMKNLNEMTNKKTIACETWRTSSFEKSRTIGVLNVKGQTEDSRLMYQLNEAIAEVIEKFNKRKMPTSYRTSSNGKDMNDKFTVEFKFDKEYSNAIEKRSANFIKNKVKVGKKGDKKKMLSALQVKTQLANAIATS